MSNFSSMKKNEIYVKRMKKIDAAAVSAVPE